MLWNTCQRRIHGQLIHQRITTHISGLQNLHFISLTHFCSLGWARSFMNIWRRCRQIKVWKFPLQCRLALHADDLELFQTTYILRSSYFTFLLRRSAFPHIGVECNANHHYHGSCIEVSSNWFFIKFREEADGRPTLLTWIFPAGSISEAEGVRTPDARKFCLWKQYCIVLYNLLASISEFNLVSWECQQYLDTARQQVFALSWTATRSWCAGLVALAWPMNGENQPLVNRWTG